MKTINKSKIISLGLMAGLLACGSPELPVPNVNAPVGVYKANFTFANATVDAPTLNFFVNGVSLGTAAPSAALASYTNVPITTPGTTGSATANTSIRAKAPVGSTIGGELGSADLIYRSANNGINNFAAVNNASYTVIAVDTIKRPKPVRLARYTVANPLGTPGVTYWNPNNKSFISQSRRDSLNPLNCQTIACPTCTGCDNWDAANQVQTTSTANEFNNLILVGQVPLGMTDPGGVRFYVTTDVPTVFNAGTAVTNAGIRFVNGIVNSNNITAAANANGTFGGPPVYARLNGGVPINLTGLTNPPNPTNAFVAGTAGGFNPTAGSRTAGGVGFTSQAIAVAGVPNAYTLQLATDNAFTNIVYSAPISFPAGKSYTIFVRGKFTTLTGIQSTISHGVITH